MELNNAQAVQQSDRRRFFIQRDLDSRRVHFLAEQFVAELLNQFDCFHGVLVRQRG